MNAEAYQKRVNELLPRSRTGLQCLKAFSVGGGICCLGQLIQDLGRTYLDLDKEQAGTVCSLCLIFLAGLLTALGVFGPGHRVSLGGARHRHRRQALPDRRPRAGVWDREQRGVWIGVVFYRNLLKADTFS